MKKIFKILIHNYGSKDKEHAITKDRDNATIKEYFKQTQKLNSNQNIGPPRFCIDFFIALFDFNWNKLVWHGRMVSTFHQSSALNICNTDALYGVELIVRISRLRVKIMRVYFQVFAILHCHVNVLQHIIDRFLIRSVQRKETHHPIIFDDLTYCLR